MSLCKTSVRVPTNGFNGFRFAGCGKVATETVYVGAMLCHYCAEHAAEARAFNSRMGADKVADIHRRMGVAR